MQVNLKTAIHTYIVCTLKQMVEEAENIVIQLDKEMPEFVPKFDLMVDHSSILAPLSTSTSLPNSNN